MREEIVEQLGVTPTPGGLELLLRQSENNRMAHGGIVHLAGGGGALMNPYERGDAAKVTAAQANPFSPYYTGAPATSLTSKIGTNALIANSQPGSAWGEVGQILKGMAPDAMFSGMTGGLGPLIKRVAGSIWNKFGGQGSRTRLLQQMKDAGASQDQLDEVEGMSTHEFQEATEGYKIGDALPGQDMSANRSTAMSLMAMPTYGAMYNVGGSRGFGRGAGGNFGEGQRMERRERRIMKNMPIEQRLELERRGFGRGAQAARERVAANPSAGLSKPSNYDELAAYYIKHGGFDENAPVTQWGDG